jgi:arginine utilization protein RocB
MSTSISDKIQEVFYQYIRINSESGSTAENLVGAFFHQYFSGMPYFQEHPDQLGSYPIANDPFARRVEWAFVRGQGTETVVLLHHLDVVQIEDYGLFKPFAFDPIELEKALRENVDGLSPEIRQDLLSGKYIFGRGAADAKGGGAIQMALLEEFSQEENLIGNILLLAVPDEENLSAGMRSAVSLMAELKAKYQLDYVLLIDSEPQTPKNASTGTLAAGAVGKLLPFVYVRGILSHAYQAAEGFNPLAVLSEVVASTEMNLELVEVQMDVKEITPLPTWLMVRDSKTSYDVSLPLSAFGCINIFTLTNRPRQVLQTLRDLCEGAAAKVTSRINRVTDAYYLAKNRPPRKKAWKTQVLSFDEYLTRLKDTTGADFDRLYRKIMEDNLAALYSGKQSMASATWSILDQLAQLDETNQPIVVIGLVPPVYPSLTYTDRPNFSATIHHISKVLNELSTETWGQFYEVEPYMGVSDLSYTSLTGASEMEKVVTTNMPLYGEFYHVPFKDLAFISMPCINIGPRSKDVQKMGERVLKEDLLERTPQMIAAAVRAALAWGT